MVGSSPFHEATLTIVEDPNADARSLMMRAPCVCNGEANGVQCKYYWAIVQKFRAANADAVRSGEKQRGCHLVDGFMLEYTSEEKPTYCNSYEPRVAGGLVALVQRAAAEAVGLAPQAGRLPVLNKTSKDYVTWGFVPFDSEYEDFHPMTNEEIAALRKEMPDRPIQWFGNKNPASMTVDDIVNGPQINILKPGEELPTSETLSKESETALDGIFGGDKPDGLLTKK